MAKRKQGRAVGLLAAALTTALSFAACGGKVIVDEDPDGSPSSCAVACGAQHPEGYHLYKLVAGQCLCPVTVDACMGDCRESVCHPEEPPTDACLPCVKASLETEHCMLAGLFGSCRADGDCSAYIACLEGC